MCGVVQKMERGGRRIGTTRMFMSVQRIIIFVRKMNKGQVDRAMSGLSVQKESLKEYFEY